MFASLNWDSPAHNITVVLLAPHSATIPVKPVPRPVSWKMGQEIFHLKAPITNNSNCVVLLVIKLEALHSHIVEKHFKLHENM